ncbi:hypothetical protein ZWY2020_041808 [Hordeum vulgare]|nr:hypothetical protein ZWY2020_041808 [Hordeum vulgare]
MTHAQPTPQLVATSLLLLFLPLLLAPAEVNSSTLAVAGGSVICGVMPPTPLHRVAASATARLSSSSAPSPAPSPTLLHSGTRRCGMGMDQGDAAEEGRRRIASLQVARSALKAGVERSRALSHALARMGGGVGEIQARLTATEAGLRPIRASRDALEGAGPNIDRVVGPNIDRAIGPNIDRAVSPAAAVLKVFDAVHGLQTPLLAGAAAKEDLSGYLALVGCLEEALRFLADNCGLAIDWLSDIVDYIGK